ncbi:MAG: DUF4129 domain-containing protein [Pseudomonadota bacterium]
MTSLVRLLSVVLWLAWAGSSLALEPVEETLRLGPSGQEYLEAAERRVSAGVAYFDPSRVAPNLETDATPQDTAKDQAFSEVSSSQLEFIFTVACLIVLGLIGFFFWRNGSAISVSFGRDIKNPGRQRISSDQENSLDPASLQDFQTILAEPDRQLALIQLARRALALAVASNDMLLQASWTARDAFNRIPPSQNHREALKELVFAAEGAQFGDHPVDEAEFTAHLDRIRPLLREART